MVSFSANVDLPPTPWAPGAARSVLSALLAGWAAPQSRVDAALLVNELVSNAVEHAGGDDALSLQVRISDGWLWAAVADGSTAHPVILEPSSLQARGRGVRLIATVADRWGSENYGDGKRVWFELGPQPDGHQPDEHQSHERQSHEEPVNGS
jgi:anti-sigma regulatory factor (Ser/Thr protein kinase)